MSTIPNEARSRRSPITAYTPVVFAFLSFSSSPRDFVYWIPAQTIAPTASSAPKLIAHSAIVMIFVVVSVRVSVHLTSTPLVHWEQSERKSKALWESCDPIEHSAKSPACGIRNIRKRRKYFIRV
jgi:hypothetical protein